MPFEETTNWPEVSVYTDGSCLKNPGGAGGFGVVMVFKEHRAEMSLGYRSTTNNRMELKGVIMALKRLKRPCSVVVTTDSEYVANAFNKKWILKWEEQRWAGVKNPDLWMDLRELERKHRVKFVWVRGHTGHPENERCDVMAYDAAKNRATETDYAYEMGVESQKTVQGDLSL